MQKSRTHKRSFCGLGQRISFALIFSLAFFLIKTQDTFADSVSITVPSNINIQADTGTQAKTEVTKTLDLTVNSSSSTGYKLYFSSDSAETGLVSTTGNSFKITSVYGNNNNLSSAMNNQYGYNTETVDNKLYNYIPALASPALIRNVTTQLTAADDFKFNLGFALRNNIPAGSYQRKLIFTLISEGESTGKIVNGTELNKALKKGLGITDQNYFNDPLKTTSNSYYPDLNISVGKNKCSNDITPERTSLISTPDSEAPVYLGGYRNSWDKYCIWTPATKLIFPENLSYMFSGLTNINRDLSFTFNDGRDSNMLDFSKVKDASHLFHKTTGYYSNKFKADEFTNYLKKAEVENIESLYEDSGISVIDDASFMSNAKNISNLFKNAKYLETADLSTWTISDMKDASSIFENSALREINLSNSTFENTTNTQNMFKNSAATTITLGNATFNNVENASGMFENTKATTITMPKATFNNVENASGMFKNAQAATISMPETTFSSTTDFSNMFNGATNASNIDLSKITFSAATNLSGMFKDTSADQLVLNNNNLGGNNITDMSYMFENSKVKNIDLGSMQTGPLTAVAGIFKGASELKTVTLPTVFNTSNVTDMSSLFENASKLTTINNFDKLDIKNALNLSHLFANTPYLSQANIIPNLKADKVTNTSYMFAKAYANGPVTFPSTFNTANLTDMSYMFQNLDTPQLDISHFDLSNVTTLEGTFSSESKTSSAGKIIWPGNNLNLPHLTSMRGLFKYNSYHTEITLPIFHTPNLTDTSYMFYGIGNITKLDNINTLETANVENMEGMFGANSSGLLRGANVKFEFNTGKVKNMSFMFNNTYVLNLDLSSFDTRSLVNAESMFNYTWLKILDLTNWDTRNLENTTSMFAQSTWLQYVYASESFVTTKVTKSNDMFYGVTSNLNYIGNNVSYARINKPGAPGAFTKKT